MCKLEWVVEGQVITGEEEQFTVDMEELDEDGDQFTSVFTTLTMLPQENKHKQLSATCRFSIFGSLFLSADLLLSVSVQFVPPINCLLCRVKSYGNDFTIDLSSSSSITIECEKMLSKLLVPSLIFLSRYKLVLYRCTWHT